MLVAAMTEGDDGDSVDWSEIEEATQQAQKVLSWLDTKADDPVLASNLAQHLDLSWEVLRNSSHKTLTFLHPTGLHIHINLMALELEEAAAVALASALADGVKQGLVGAALVEMTRTQEGGAGAVYSGVVKLFDA